MNFNGNDQANNAPSIGVIRLLGLFTAAIVPPFRLILPADAWDPMWMRWTLSGIALAIVLCSYAWPVFVRYSKLFTYGLCFLITTWMLGLAVKNNLIQEYASSYFIMLFATIILFREFKWLFIFAGYSGIIVACTVFTISQPHFSPITFTAMVFSIMGIGSMGQLAGMLDMQQTQRQETRLQLLNQAALAASNEGIIVTDHNGRLLRHNGVFRSLFGIVLEDSDVLPMETWIQAIQKQLVAPEFALRLATAVTQDKLAVFNEQFELINGSYVRVLSKPYQESAEKHGRIWFFKDVSASERLKAATAQRELRLKKQNEMLMLLSTDAALQAGDLSVVAPIVATEAANALEASRVSVWRLSADGTRLDCENEYDSKTGLLGARPSIHAAVGPDYFKLIATERMVVIDDSVRNPLTARFYEGLTLPRKPNHMMQVPLRLGGKLFGVLSAARENETPNWALEDQQFLASIGDLLMISLEVGERRKAELELANSAALLKAVFELAGVGILVTRADGTVIDCNNTYLEIFEMTREFLGSAPETVMEYCRSLMVDAEQAKTAIQYLIEHPHQNESNTFFFKDGRIAERYTEVLRVDGQIIGRVWFYRDVTFAVKAQQRLRDSEMRNQAIIDAIPDLMLRISSRGDIIDLKMPDRWELAHIVRDAKAVHLRDLFPDEIAVEILEQVENVLAAQKLVEQERLLELMGTSRDYETRIAPSGTDEVLIMLRDVTERKKTEKELMQRNHELDSFVYRASHDLKAPLNSLMGLIDIIQNESHDAHLDRYLQLMDKSVLKLDTFVRNLTDFTRINRLALQKRMVNFEEIFAEVKEGLHYMQNADRIQQQFSMQLAQPFYGDSFHLGIVLGNLISNAIKYYDPQKAQPQVAVTVTCDATHCSIIIVDNGLGIPQKHQDRIFELFFRATNQSFGSGIGLYITRNAVNKMGGTIEMASEEGVGTTFTINLPNTVLETDKGEQSLKQISETAQPER